MADAGPVPGEATAVRPDWRAWVRSSWQPAAAAALVFAGMFLVSRRDYLLFHSLAEIFSIVVAFAIFALGWNSRRAQGDGFLVFLGVAYLAVGFLDLLHTLAYAGMGVFHAPGSNLATQLWVSARYVESLSLLVAAVLVGRRLNMSAVAFAYVAVTGALVSAVFWWRVFPTCYVEGQGLTAFKKLSEYGISAVLAASGLVLWRRRRHLDAGVCALLIGSIAATIGSELLFTLYKSPTGPANMLGHVLKIVSFYLIYRAIVVTGIMRPYALIFRDLAEGERRLRHERSQMEAVLRQMPAGVLIAEAPSGRIVLSNARMGEILREPMEPLDGIASYGRYRAFRTDGTPYKPEDWPMARSVLSGETVRNEEVAVLRPDGTVASCLMSSAPIRDETGSIVAAAGAVLDVTEENRIRDALRTAHHDLEARVTQRTAELEAANRALQFQIAERRRAERTLDGERRRLFAILEELPALVFMVAPDHTIPFANRAFRQIVGAVDGRKCYELLGFDGPCPECEVEGVLRTGKLQQWERAWPNGRTYHFLGYPFVEADGSPTVLRLGIDVTERKEAEARILAHQEELRSLAAELSLAEERERRRIAQVLHDQIGQLLAVAKIKLGAARARARASEAAALDEVRALLDQCIKQARTMTFELASPVLYEVGLEAALKSLAEATEREHGLHVRFEDDGLPKPVHDDVRVLLFRAAQELVLNVVKHARARSALISISRGDGLLHVSVEDDGVGFDLSALSRTARQVRGFGLFSIRERLGHVGGRLDVRSEPGRGTTATMSAPLELSKRQEG